MKIRDNLVQRIPTYVHNFTIGISDGLWQRCVMCVTSKNSWRRKIKIWVRAFQVKIILKEGHQFMRWGGDQGTLFGTVVNSVYNREGECLQPSSS